MSRNRTQNGTLVQISGNWHIRYWESQNIAGTIERKRVSHQLGPVTTRGKNPPPDVKASAAQHMAGVAGSKVTAEQTVTTGLFFDSVFWPWAEASLRPSTRHGYKSVWRTHLEPLCKDAMLKDVRTPDCQQWMDAISKAEIGRSMLRLTKSLGRVIFRVAEQRGYFEHPRNPFAGVGLSKNTPPPAVTYAYNSDEVSAMLAVVPEPAATAVALAAYTGLGKAEIQGLQWQDYRDGRIFVTRNIWNGKVTQPKTDARRASVPVIKQLAAYLDMHRLRAGEPQDGPIFRTGLKTPTPLSLDNVVNRAILPALNRCAVCRKAETDHAGADHDYKRDGSRPEWHGWHAFRRGLATNLHQLHVQDKTISTTLRHSTVAVTQACYIKGNDASVQDAMESLENSLTDTFGTLTMDSRAVPGAAN